MLTITSTAGYGQKQSFIQSIFIHETMLASMQLLHCQNIPFDI